MAATTIPSSSEAPTSQTVERGTGSHSDSDSVSGLSDLDEDGGSDPTLATLQKARLSELKKAAESAIITNNSTSSAPPSGPHLQAFSSEKAAMKHIAASPTAVLLFTHKAFPVCGEMAGALGTVAGKLAGANADPDVERVAFLSLDAEAAPFLTRRLGVRVLPCVVGYRAGEEAGRLVGFEGLGRKGRGAGAWRRVAVVLRSWGVLGQGRLLGEGDDEEDEDDEDEDESEPEDENIARMKGGSWIGAQRLNSKVSAKGTARKADNDDDDDDWD